MGFPTASQAIGFIAADAFDANRTTFNSLAFQASGQTQAYLSDSGPDVSDRKNVRDGHYTIWGYEHFIVKTTGGAMSQQAMDFIGYVNGTKTSTSFDYVALEGGAGVIPQCAMKVKRTSDGGLLSAVLSRRHVQLRIRGGHHQDHAGGVHGVHRHRCEHLHGSEDLPPRLLRVKDQRSCATIS